jgi:DNA polymerase-1
MPLSVKQILGTSGGGTKLDHAIRLIANPLAEVQRVTLSTPPRWRDEVIAVDIEVSGDIQVDEPEDTELLSVSVARQSSPTTIETYAFTQEALRSPETRQTLIWLVSANRTIWHNGKFDCRWLIPYLGRTIYPDHDTMLMHACLYPAAGENSLKDLAKRMFNAPDWEADVKKYTRSKAHYERIPQDVLVDYNQWDVYWTIRLFDRLWDELDYHAPAKALYYKHVLPASHMLQDVEQYGMPVDTEYGELLSEELGIEISRITDDLRDLVHSDTFNPGSTQQIQQILTNRWGYTLSSTDEKSLATLRLTQIPDDLETFCGGVLDYRSLSKIRGTYLTGILSKVRDGRVHPTFLLHGTSTGRLSSRKPNAQNLKNDEEGRPSVKRMFHARPGRAIVGVDYAQAELRVMAELSGDELMIADLQADAPDFFDNMLPSVFPDVDFTLLTKEQRKPYRLRLKRVVYGTSYGLTAPSVATLLTLEGTPTTAAEAAFIQNGYLGRYPGLRAWRASIGERVVAGDDLITPFGRRFQQDTVTAGYWRRIQALAFTPQSIASDICVTAAIALHPLLLTMDAHIIVLVHDQICAECPEEDAQEVADLIAENMREAARLYFTRTPFLCDGHFGAHLAQV